MRSRELSQLRRFRRVDNFVRRDGRPIVGARIDKVLGQLRSAVARIERAAAEHDAVRRLSMRKTREERALLEELRELHMLRVSRMVNAGTDAPAGLSRGMRSPHKRTATYKTLAAAHAMAGLAEKHLRWFVSQGLETGFVDAYRKAIAAVERVGPERDALLRRQLEASAVIETQLQQGKRLVRALDAVLRRELRSDATLLATWRATVESGRRR